MSMQLRAFRPLGNNQTVNIAVTASSQSLTIPGVPYGTRAVRIVNLGTDTIFIEFQDAATGAAVATSMPMVANTVEVFTLPNDKLTIKVIGAAGALSTMYVTYGEGL